MQWTTFNAPILTVQKHFSYTVSGHWELGILLLFHFTCLTIFSEPLHCLCWNLLTHLKIKVQSLQSPTTNLSNIFIPSATQTKLTLCALGNICIIVMSEWISLYFLLGCTIPNIVQNNKGIAFQSMPGSEISCFTWDISTQKRVNVLESPLSPTHRASPNYSGRRTAHKFYSKEQVLLFCLE